MSFWKKVKQTAIVDRLVEEKLYAQVLREFESGVRRDGLWAKAFQNSQGDEQKANALYIGYRVQSIKDEAEIADMLAGQYKVESKQTPAKLNDTQAEHQQKKTELLKCRNCGHMVSQLKGDLCTDCSTEKRKCGLCGCIFNKSQLKGDLCTDCASEKKKCGHCGYIFNKSLLKGDLCTDCASFLRTQSTYD
jgi:hypothetical protein